MSAQNLLFSNLPVSSLGLYDTTTQTIQTINSDSSGNINLNSNVIVGNTLQTAGGIGNGSGTITTYNVNAGGSVSAYNISASNNVSTPNMSVTGTLNAANIVNSNSFTGGSADFSGTCNAQVLALDSLSTSNPVPTSTGQGQLFLYGGVLYFYNPSLNGYYTINVTLASAP